MRAFFILNFPENQKWRIIILKTRHTDNKGEITKPLLA